MKLTPLDIHHKEFRLVLRGYNQEQVDQFLDEVADELERLFKENIDLSEKLEAANERVRSYAEIEKTLHNTMLAAQTSAEEIKNRATKEADGMLRDAEIKAKELVQTALSERQRTQAEFMKIKAAEDAFRMRFREMLEDYMRKIHETPVAPEVAALVGLAAAPEPMTDFAPPVVVEPASPAEGVAEEVAITPPAAVDEPVPAGPPVAPEVGEATGPIEPDAAPDAPAEASVQALTLGEVAPPEMELDVPTFGEPMEFAPTHFGGVGERDEDLDIEQID
jgi:cell division initiation protein